MADPKVEIWAAIQRANAAWLAGRPHDVGVLFDEHVVLASPGGAPRTVGREAMVKSVVEYCDQVDTHEFDELEHSVDLFGDTAVASYRFHVIYDLDGERHEETGRELLVFTHRPEGWRAVWRMQLPSEDIPKTGPKADH